MVITDGADPRRQHGDHTPALAGEQRGQAGEDQRRADSVDQQQVLHGGLIDRPQRFLRTRAGWGQNAGGDHHQIEGAVQTLHRRVEGCRITEIQPIGAAGQAGDSISLLLKGVAERRPDTARSPENQCALHRCFPSGAAAVCTSETRIGRHGDQ